MNWIDFGFEVEMPCWVFILCILVALAITILGFISAMKTRKVINKYINKKFGSDDDILFKLNRKKGKPFEIDEFQDDEEGVEAVKESVNDMAKNIAEQADAVRILEILKPYLKEVIKINKNMGYLSIRFKPIEYGTLEVDGTKNEVADRINIIKRWLNNE